MKPEIKQRIEQIKAGQVPDGYKRTRAGIMPYDWCCDREYRAKDIFKSITNKKHNGEFDVLSATQDKGVIPREQVDINIKYNKDSVAGYKKVDKGDFVISLRSFQGGIEYSEYEGLVSPAYTVLKPIIPICDEYYKYYFKTSDYINRLNIGTYGIRDGKQIGYEDFGDMVIHYPPLAEQEKIAKILSTQDRIIELYQRKIEEMQKMKKVYLSKMFPRKGKNVPEWRFPQFTAPWEQRKAKEVCSISTGKSNTQDQVDDGKYPFYIRSDVPVRSNKYLYDCEAVITIGDGNIGKVFHYVNGKFDLHQRCYKMTDFKDIWGKYFFYYFSTKFYDRAMKMTAKATVDSVRLEMISEMDIKKPPQISEQKQIAEFFTYLDNLITLHQRKLEETKKYKKALMQLLLTGIVRYK